MDNFLFFRQNSPFFEPFGEKTVCFLPLILWITCGFFVDKPVEKNVEKWKDKLFTDFLKIIKMLVK